MLEVYDPMIRWINSTAELESIVAEADEKDAALWVVHGHRSYNVVVFPEVLAAIENAERFPVRETFEGIEPEFYFWFCEYTGP